MKRSRGLQQTLNPGDSMKVEHALIIAAGRGSRFEAGTANRPKPLIEVAGIPLILRVVKSAQAAGIEHFTVVTGYRGEVLEEYLIREMSGMKTDVRCIRNPEWERPNGDIRIQGQRHDAPGIRPLDV